MYFRKVLTDRAASLHVDGVKGYILWSWVNIIVNLC